MIFFQIRQSFHMQTRWWSGSFSVNYNLNLFFLTQSYCMASEEFMVLSLFFLILTGCDLQNVFCIIPLKSVSGRLGMICG